MRLTENFTLEELTHSATAVRKGVNNIPGSEEVSNLRALCRNVLQPARIALGIPLFVTSGFRSDSLNRVIGGVLGSQHMQGEASDIKCEDNKSLFDFIHKHLEFDQLIWEYGDDKQPDWVHVSYKRKGNNRSAVLQAFRVNGRTIYKTV